MSELLPLQRAASRFGLQPNWLKKEAAEGRVPCLQAGNRFLFDEDTLSESLRQRAANPFTSESTLAAANGGILDRGVVTNLQEVVAP